MRTFEQWDIDDVERTFQLHVPKNNKTLSHWLQAHHEPSDIEHTIIEKLQHDIHRSIDAWNEDELKFKFIAPFVSLIGFNTDKFQTFTQRTLSATVDSIKLSGKVDFLVATGKSKPVQLFFFLHEYKRLRGRENDPLAQLLVEMLAAQELNQHKFPMYGCHVIGRNWFFVVLEGRKYAESNQYSVSDDGIYKVFSMLREAKAIITKLTA
jgi:hypothetical protein